MIKMLTYEEFVEQNSFLNIDEYSYLYNENIHRFKKIYESICFFNERVIEETNKDVVPYYFDVSKEDDKTIIKAGHSCLEGPCAEKEDLTIEYNDVEKTIHFIIKSAWPHLFDDKKAYDEEEDTHIYDTKIKYEYGKPFNGIASTEIVKYYVDGKITGHEHKSEDKYEWTLSSVLTGFGEEVSRTITKKNLSNQSDCYMEKYISFSENPDSFIAIYTDEDITKYACGIKPHCYADFAYGCSYDCMREFDSSGYTLKRNLELNEKHGLKEITKEQYDEYASMLGDFPLNLYGKAKTKK